MPDAKFLETYPLYRKFYSNIPATLNKIGKVPINMHCGTCSGNRTFNMFNEYYDGSRFSDDSTAGQIRQAIYRCSACKSYKYYFLLKFSSDNTWVEKSGQSPAWKIKTEKDLSALLGNHESLYVKGLICESQSYGIGAFAYYRRIVEEIIDKLLSEVEELIDDGEKEKYQEALKKTQETRVTSEKIELVQDLLPAVLRPNGMNPLALLHRVLSEGLHASTDEKCLELAAEAKEIIVFLSSRVASASKDAREFTLRMQSLLQKKDKTDFSSGAS